MNAVAPAPDIQTEGGLRGPLGGNALDLPAQMAQQFDDSAHAIRMQDMDTIQNEPQEPNAPSDDWDQMVFQIKLTPQEYQMVMNEKKRRGIAF